MTSKKNRENQPMVDRLPGVPADSMLLSAMNALAYPLAFLPGYLTLDTSIKRSIYKNFARHGTFNDLQKARQNEYKAAVAQVKAGETHSIASDITKVEEEYRQAVRQRFESMGFHGPTDYWKGLTRNQKIDAMVLGATVSGIVLGSLLLMTEKSWLQNLVNRSKDTEDQDITL